MTQGKCQNCQKRFYATASNHKKYCSMECYKYCRGETPEIGKYRMAELINKFCAKSAPNIDRIMTEVEYDSSR